MTDPAKISFRPLRRIVKYAAGVSLVLAFAYLGWLYWLFTGGVFKTSRFDPVIWFAKPTNATDATCFRGSMAEHVKTHVLRPGQSPQVVKQLLGEPDHAGPAGFEYTLGMCSGLGIDFDSLNVYFNERGELTSVTIVQH